MRKGSIKSTRINGEVQKELSKLIALEVKDPRIDPLASVIEADVATDLKSAKIYISVLGSKETKENTIKGLKSAAPFLRSQLAKNLNLRNTPELHFVLDETFEKGMEMTKLIDSVVGKEEKEEQD